VAADMTTDPGASHLEGSPFRRLLLERTPRVIATPALIVANVLIYAATAGASGQTEPRPDVLVGWGALFGPGVANGEWWRLVSAMFLHAGILHIALNCLFLRQIGNLVERLMGSFAFLTIYLVTGVTGAMASLMAHPRSIGVGASGRSSASRAPFSPWCSRQAARCASCWTIGRSRSVSAVLTPKSHPVRVGHWATEC